MGGNVGIYVDQGLEPGRVADQLVMLRDGAMVSGYLSDPAAVAAALRDAGRAIIAAGTKPPR